MRCSWILLFLLPLTLAAADVTGKWDSTVELDAGTGTPTFTFRQQGNKLTGRYSGQLGEADLTGKVDGDSIEFSFSLKSDLGELTANFSGKIEGDTMKGKAVYGQLGSGTFTAKRAKP
jgi:hypothetical protein